MKNFILFSILFVSFYVSKSQNCIDKIEKLGFNYYSIPDTCYSEIKNIEFIVSAPIDKNNPTIIFLQGSGNSPLIFYYENNGGDFYLIPPFKIEPYKQKFNFVCISKPGTPVCKKFEGPPPLIDTTFSHYMDFAKMDFLDYYVAQTHQVINYLQENVLSKETPIYLIGNSQGGRVAIKYTAIYPEKIKKLVLYSSGIMDRAYGEILSLRKDADYGKISAEVAQKKIDEIYAYYLELRKYHDYFIQKPDAEIQYTIKQHYSSITDYTYNFDISLEYLLKINIPILCVYGTDDLGVRNDNDQLPLIFTRAYKSNLTMLPKLNCDHHFVQHIYNPKTQKTESNYIGDEVFNDIVKWFFGITKNK